MTDCQIRGIIYANKYKYIMKKNIMVTATIFKLKDDGLKEHFDTVNGNQYFLTQVVQSKVSDFIRTFGYGYWETEMTRGYSWAPDNLAILASCKKVRGTGEWIYHKFIVELSE